MKIQVLLSTMHQGNYDILDKMNIQSDAIVVNQCNMSGKHVFHYKNYDICWINSSKRGLSKSRNVAINEADGDICLLADDDLVYVNELDKLIIESFDKYPEADIIAFQVQGIEGSWKNYHEYFREVGFLTSMKISSVEIAFRLESIKKAGVKFDELFGAGSKYIMGEENIFLYECLRRNLNIIYLPVKIADLHIGDSTWFNGYNEEYFLSKGAAFTRMTQKFSFILILQFAIRKYKLFYPNVKIHESIKYMLKGRRQYLSNFKD